jgi:hypothetical protein
MRTEETALLKTVSGLRASGSRKWAAVLDLDRVPHVDDPFFFRVIKNRIMHDVDVEVVEVFTLSRHRICFVGSRDEIDAIDRKAVHLSRMLLEHSKAPIECELYDLAKHMEDFVEVCRKLAAEARELNGEEDDSLFSDADENLARYLSIEQTLHSADLSSLVRERPIYDFSEKEDPHVIAYELSSDIENLEDMFGVSIRQNPWLFDRVTEILDKRMLFHLERDRGGTDRIISINIHMANVLSDEFKAFAQRASVGWQKHFVFEMPYVETIDDPTRFHYAIERLRTYHAKGGVDGVPWTSLRDIQNSADTIELVKVPWAEPMRDLSEAQREELQHQIDRVGGARCVLYHCDDPDAAAIGLDLGFQLLQGQAVDEDVAELHRQLVDRKVARVRALAAIEDDDDEDEEEPSGGVGAWLKGLFGGGKRRQDDDRFDDF